MNVEDEDLEIEKARNADWSCDVCGLVAQGFSYIGAHLMLEHQGGTATEVEKVC